MRVLLVSVHYPPDPAVGSVRARRVATALAEAGHQIEVLTVRGPGMAHAAAGEARIHRVRRLPNARELALWARALFRRASGNRVGTGGSTGWIVRDDVPGWKRFLVAMALLPDAEQGFILPALVRALRLRRTIDLVYTSGPPHSAHVVGLLLKRLTGVRWAAEFRDPWTDNAVQPRYAISDTAAAVKARLERSTLSRADHVIAVSDATAALLAAKLPHAARGRVAVVRNGIAAGPAPPRVAHSGLRILYLGSLYHGRDPRPFLEALAALRMAGDPCAARATAEFVGECRYFRGLSVEGMIRDLGLGDVVRVRDAVPREQVPALMAGADVLLLLAQQQPLQVPAKLYEYLAARRPILAFADAEGETASMLGRVGGHFLATSAEGASARDALSRALEAAARGERCPMDEGVLAEWSADRQMARLVSLLNSAPPTHA